MNLLKSRWADCEQRQWTVTIMIIKGDLTEQFIHRLDNEGMIRKILREIPALEDNNVATS